MKNVKISIALVAVIATVLVISAYNYDENRPTQSGRLGTAVRDTTGVVTDTAEGVVGVATSAVKDTASILTTGERRSEKEVKREAKEKKQRGHERRKENDKRRDAEKKKRRTEERKAQEIKQYK